MDIIEQLKAAKGTPPTILKSIGDEPSCPKCGMYNAMLHHAYYDGVNAVKCRDCGHIIVNSKVVYPKHNP